MLVTTRCGDSPFVGKCEELSLGVIVQFGRDFYPLSIHAEGYEEVRTPMGKYKTLVLVPRMEKDPKGLFKRGGEIKVWIAQDGSRLPVKMQLKLNFGSATLLLSSYQAPK